MVKRVVAAFCVAVVVRVSASACAASADEVIWYKPMPGIVPAPATVFGLYKGSDFRLTSGACSDCPTPKQALWYFRSEVVAVPVEGVPVAGFTRGVDAQEDVRRWYASATTAQWQARPPLLWLGATHTMRDVKLTDDNRLLFTDGRGVDFKPIAKIDSNRSYYDDSSAAFLRQRALRMRGELRGNTFTARTVWPQDWVIDEKKMLREPLLADESLQSIVRRHQSARNESYEARLLWERTPEATASARDWSGRAVIALMLNGAQGDDDEAHGGHLAIATGRHAAGGAWADWMVNNFYDLGVHSEKGIIAAMLPMDNYLGDLNSGQSWYRPSYMLVAVLRSDRAAYAYQAAMARVYHHFYRNDFKFHHARANCAGISLDTLRALGWPIAASGPPSPISQLRAIFAYPYKAITERSFAAGRAAYDYLVEEPTRLYPAAAFDAAGRDLLGMASISPAGDKPDATTSAVGKPLDALLREDLEALVFVRIPQMPSSRAFGAHPVSSYDEYMARVPADKAQWKVVPVAPRQLPQELWDGAAAGATPPTRPPWPVWLAGVALIACVAALLWVVRRLRGSQSPAVAAENI